jgi:phosphate transport system permease protein
LYAGSHLTAAPTSLPTQRRFGLRFGDALLYGVTGAFGVGAIALIVAIAYKLVTGANLAFSEFGLGFITTSVWDPVKEQFGALSFIGGTLLTAFFALLLAGPLAIAIALFLTELAPRWLRTPIGTLVELLAAIPSVVLGLWGIIILIPLLNNHVNPWLHSNLGFIPLFGEPKGSGFGYLAAILVLTIMTVPIVASVCRELFRSVPEDLEEGALALGSTRWEMIRGVILPYTRSGIVAAVILGLGRALGEAIAVTQVIGGASGFSWNLLSTGDTIASRIASTYQGFPGNIGRSSLIYLAVILLVISVIVNVIAQLIVRRFEFQRTGGS